MKLYIVSDGDRGIEDIDGVYYLVSENGEVLYRHWCSSIFWAKDDLYFGRPERIKECEKRWKSVEILMLGQDKMTKNELIKRNHAWFAKRNPGLYGGKPNES